MDRPIRYILEAMSGRLIRVVYNAESLDSWRKRFRVILDESETVWELEYEDNNWNTKNFYAVSRRKLDKISISDIREEVHVIELSIFEALIRNVPRYLIEKLEKRGAILDLNEVEFEEWSADKINGEDYLLYNIRGEQELSMEDFIDQVKPVDPKRYSGMKAEEELKGKLGIKKDVFQRIYL